jgi:hypothetical protein
MNIREHISKYLSALNETIGKESNIANNILNIIDNAGLELDEWREDTGIEQWTEDKVIKYLELNATPDCLAIAILFMLEDQGLSLSGNGWLDDDELTIRIIDEIYDAINGKIKSTSYQHAYQIAKK